MPKAPSDMSHTAVARRAVLADELRISEMKKAAAAAKAVATKKKIKKTGKSRESGLLDS